MIKRPILPILMIISGIIAGILIAGALYALTGFSVFGGAQSKTVSVEDAENVEMTTLAYRILEYIRDDDYAALSNVVHPEFGVVFSPYATVTISAVQRFSAKDVANFSTDSHVYVWGVYNGSGQPIEHTPVEYITNFVPAADFFGETIIGINRIVRRGNALENITEVFPNVKFIDFHLPGQETGEELDWRSLRLGFEEYNGYFRLVVIIYSTWTA